MLILIHSRGLTFIEGRLLLYFGLLRDWVCYIALIIKFLFVVAEDMIEVGVRDHSPNLVA
jgi:hypothetical protein